MNIRTLIVDDQLMAREHLRRMLEDQPGIELVGQAATGMEAIDSINNLSPDLVFLDVRMPDLDGFAVLSQISNKRIPAIIFVTANDDFAVRAFEVHALDYLIKPCAPDRLDTALQRARDQIKHKRTGDVQERLNALLADLQIPPKHPERLAVKSNGRIVFLHLADIDWVEAADNYVNLHTGSESHLLRETMAMIEARLPGDRFVRIGRSTIVNVERIKELQPMFHGDYAVLLRSGARLTLTRGYRHKLEHLGVV
jgi:two-component system LytT family response regulator